MASGSGGHALPGAGALIRIPIRISLARCRDAGDRSGARFQRHINDTSLLRPGSCAPENHRQPQSRTVAHSLPGAAGAVRGVEANSLRGRETVLAWMLGNEVPSWVMDQLGAAALERRLRTLAGRVRERDPGRLLGHSNWPPTRSLDLSFLDLACFNVYPAWPYEVAVKGFGPFVREMLLPLAGGRPLLITEFGINSLEAGEERQARIVEECWREIARSGIAGGVVFERCDEWWKDYDNPLGRRRPPNADHAGQRHGG